MYKLIALTLVAAVGCNDLIQGHVGGRKIYDENKEASPAIWKQTGEVTIKTNETDVISRVVIRDLRADKDGEAKITEGGQGQKNVTIEMKSPTILRGYYFHIQVYAVKESGEPEVNTEQETEEVTVSTAQAPTMENDTRVNSDTKKREEKLTVTATTEVVKITTEAKAKAQDKIEAPIITDRKTRSIYEARTSMPVNHSYSSDEEDSDDDESYEDMPHFHPMHGHNFHEDKALATKVASTTHVPDSHVVKGVSTNGASSTSQVKPVTTNAPTTLSSVSTPVASTKSQELSTSEASSNSQDASTTEATSISQNAKAVTIAPTAIPAKSTELVTESQKPNPKPFRNISQELGERVVFGIKRV